MSRADQDELIYRNRTVFFGVLVALILLPSVTWMTMLALAGVI